MDLVPQLRVSYLNYLPISTLEQIPKLLHETSKHKRNTDNSDYVNFIKQGKTLFRQLCHDLTIDFFEKELTGRVNRAMVCFISCYYPKEFAKAYSDNIYAYRKRTIGGECEIIDINTEDDRTSIPRFPQFSDKEDGVIVSNHPLAVDGNDHEDRLFLVNNNDGEGTYSRTVINREEYGFNPNSITEERTTLEENSIESGIAIGSDHSQEQQVKPKKRWKKSEESDDEDFITTPKRKKNLYY